jgi:integrase
MDGRGGPSVSGVGEAGPGPALAAYVLILVLGLRKGDVIGLSWSAVNLDRAELEGLGGVARES